MNFYLIIYVMLKILFDTFSTLFRHFFKAKCRIFNKYFQLFITKSTLSTLFFNLLYIPVGVRGGIVKGGGRGSKSTIFFL